MKASTSDVKHQKRSVGGEGAWEMIEGVKRNPEIRGFAFRGCTVITLLASDV